jgi:nucleoid-associated protein YgaU
MIFIIFAVFAFFCPHKITGIEHDENNQIFLHTEKNNDNSISGKLVLTEEHVKDVIRYIRANYPNFDFEKFEQEEYGTDDEGIAAFVRKFNENGPEYCILYIPGIEKWAGYSSVLSWLNGYLDKDEPELFSYHFFLDEEYSDYSGIMFTDYFSSTKDSESLCLWKRQYKNSDDYYWEVLWPLNDYEDADDETENEDYELYTKEEKTEILTSFLAKFRNTRVFSNIDLAWFGRVYTGIEGTSQRIRDLLWVKPEKDDFIQPVITNPRWMNVNVVITELTVDKGVTLYAETENIGEGEPVTITIRSTDGVFDELVGEYTSRVKNNAILFHWAIIYETDKMQGYLQAMETGGFTCPQYYFTVSYNMFKNHDTAFLNVRSWIRHRITDNVTKEPLKNRGYTLLLPDDTQLEGMTDSEGHIYREDIIAFGPTYFLMHDMDSEKEYEPVAPYREPDKPVYYKVKKDDSLWTIAASEFIYGNPSLWRTLYEANKHNFVDAQNPNLIEPGQVLIIPAIGGEARTGIR